MERLGVTSASATTALHLAAALISQCHPPGAHSTALPSAALPSASTRNLITTELDSE